MITRLFRALHSEAVSRSESCHEDSWYAAEGRGRGGH